MKGFGSLAFKPLLKMQAIIMGMSTRAIPTTKANVLLPISLALFIVGTLMFTRNEIAMLIYVSLKKSIQPVQYMESSWFFAKFWILPLLQIFVRHQKNSCKHRFPTKKIVTLPVLIMRYLEPYPIASACSL